MMQITFDVAKLNKDDRKIYDSMTESEKQNFERTWIAIETQKMRLIQQKNKSKERNRREQKELAERSRKERAHRLIERGAILESLLESPEEYTNDGIKEILMQLLHLPEADALITKYKQYERHTEGLTELDDNDTFAGSEFS